MSIPGVKAQESSDKLTDISQYKIQTQSYYHDPQTATFVYSNAKIELDGMTLEGTEIRLDTDKKSLVATGFIRYTDEKIVATADRLEMDLNTGELFMYNAVVFDSEAHAYITAGKIHRVDEEYLVASNCSITTCDPHDSSWKITSSEFNYYRENFSTAEGAVLHVKNVPIFYFPFVSWPNVTKRKSGFLFPEYQHISSSGKKFKLGNRLAIPYFWAIDKDHDLTVTGDIIEFRGRGVKLDYQYAFQPGIQGEIKYRRIWETKPRDPANESGSLEVEETESSDLFPPRFKFEMRHNQSLDDRSRLIFVGQLYSDGQFEREYESFETPNPNYEQNIEVSISRQFELGSASLFATNDKVFDEVAILNRNLVKNRVQQQPKFEFDFGGQPFSSSLALNTDGTIIRFRREEGIIGERAIITPNVEYQFPIFEVFKVIVGYGRRLSYYQVFNPEKPIEEVAETEVEGDISSEETTENSGLEHNKDVSFSYQIDLIKNVN